MKTTWLMLLLMTISWSLASCSDDDKDDEKSEEQQQEEAQQQADRFWDLVGQLVSSNDYTTDYKGKTFMPTIGDPDPDNALVRIVATNDMASAAQRFASLAGNPQDFDPTADHYEWSDPAVGTLNYRRTDDGRSWAVVDVDLPQVPTLQQIVYRSPQQSGDNASFPGTAYYRFGDVLEKVNDDGQPEYWICVRPAFGPEGKRKSHWVTLSPLPRKNLSTVTKYGKQYILPDGLGFSDEHMQNLAELLYAMMEPATWEGNVLGNPAPGLFSSGLRMFHDFSHNKDLVKYHNRYFWERVRHAWDTNGLFQKIFGFDSDSKELQSMYKPNGSGLHLICKNYSWLSSISNNLSLQEYTYSTGQQKAQLNMHHQSHRSVKKNMSQRPDAAIDLSQTYTLQHPYLEDAWFFGDNVPRYVIRHATGAELDIDQACGPQAKIDGATPVYLYNSFYYQDTPDGFCDINDTNLQVLTEKDNEHLDQIKNQFEGNPFYHLADVYEDQDGSRWFCISPAGGSFFKEPYSYFISFDGIRFDEGGRHAINIATRDQAIRFLHTLSNMWNQWTISENSVQRYQTRNILQHARFDLSKVFCSRNTGIGVDKVYLASVAYCTDADDPEQPYMRFMADQSYELNTIGARQHSFVFWTHYLTQPDTDKPENQGSTFSQVRINLSDVTSQDKVRNYAPDKYPAMRPSTFSDPFLEQQGVRTQADDPATFSLANYLWNQGAFASDRLSMWNERVLFFRVTKVLDRGADNHSTVNDLFQEMKLVSAMDYTEFWGEWADRMDKELYDHEWEISMPAQAMYLNGKQITLEP